MAAEQGGIEFQSDQEQEENDTDLTEDVEVVDAVAVDSPGEDREPHAGEKPSEQARSQQDAGDHFAHHLGLVKLREDPAGDTAERDDQANLQEQSQEYVAVHRAFNFSLGTARSKRTRRDRFRNTPESRGIAGHGQLA